MNPLICAGCGEWTDTPVVAGDHLVCAACGHREPFRRLPLLAVTGPSGTGKSTIARLLPGLLDDQVVVLDQDLLWTEAFHEPTDDYASFRRTWLRLTATVHQAGRPVVLCGTVVPPQFEKRPERVLFSAIHYLTLVCADEVLRDRLRTRPSWRGWDEARVAEMIDFNHWTRANAAHTHPPMTLLDTTTRTIADTAAEVAAWVRARLG